MLQILSLKALLYSLEQQILTLIIWLLFAIAYQLLTRLSECTEFWVKVDLEKSVHVK